MADLFTAFVSVQNSEALAKVQGVVIGGAGGLVLFTVYYHIGPASRFIRYFRNRCTEYTLRKELRLEFEDFADALSDPSTDIEFGPKVPTTSVLFHGTTIDANYSDEHGGWLVKDEQRFYVAKKLHYFDSDAGQSKSGWRHTQIPAMPVATAITESPVLGASPQS